MRWADERYVRVYTRDTPDWDMLPWQSRALLPLLLRKVDRAGLLDLGKHGIKALVRQVDMPEEVVEVGFSGLIEDGCISLHGTVVVVRNFIEAQETSSSDQQRKRDQRERARALVNRIEVTGESVTNRDQESQNVTIGHETGQKVTNGHAQSQAVTNGHSVLCCALPDPEEAIPDSPKAHRAKSSAFDFLAVYAIYPRKDGKSKGLKICAKVIKTQVQYDLLLVAVKRYAAEMRGTEKQFIKHFDTWMGCWTDYADDKPGVATTPKALSSSATSDDDDVPKTGWMKDLIAGVDVKARHGNG